MDGRRADNRRGGLNLNGPEYGAPGNVLYWLQLVAVWCEKAIQRLGDLVDLSLIGSHRGMEDLEYIGANVAADDPNWQTTDPIEKKLKVKEKVKKVKIVKKVKKVK